MHLIHKRAKVMKVLSKYKSFSFMVMHALVPQENKLMPPIPMWRIKIMFGNFDFGGIQVPDSPDWVDKFDKELENTLKDYEVVKDGAARKN